MVVKSNSKKTASITFLHAIEQSCSFTSGLQPFPKPNSWDRRKDRKRKGKEHIMEGAGR